MKWLFLFLCSLMSFSVFGQDEVVPAATVIDQVLNLFNTWSDLKGVAIGSVVINLIVNILKLDVVKHVFVWNDQAPMVKRALIVCLGVASGILVAIQGGVGIVDALIGGLLSSGGAIMIFEVLKPFLIKQKVEAIIRKL